MHRLSPSHESERKGTDQPEEPSIVALAQQCLASNATFHHHCQTIRSQWIDNCLVLNGQLPSFHLKQLVQEALRGLHVTIVNQIEVVCSDGLSSVPQGAKSAEPLPHEPR